MMLDIRPQKRNHVCPAEFLTPLNMDALHHGGREPVEAGFNETEHGGSFYALVHYLMVFNSDGELIGFEV